MKVVIWKKLNRIEVEFYKELVDKKKLLLIICNVGNNSLFFILFSGKLGNFLLFYLFI